MSDTVLMSMYENGLIAKQTEVGLIASWKIPPSDNNFDVIIFIPVVKQSWVRYFVIAFQEV